MNDNEMTLLRVWLHSVQTCMKVIENDQVPPHLKTHVAQQVAHQAMTVRDDLKGEEL